MLKVNDKQGNPIQVAAICVYRVQDTYKAIFDVENYKQFIKMQIEAALRKLVGLFAYDNIGEEEQETTLRQGTP